MKHNKNITIISDGLNCMMWSNVTISLMSHECHDISDHWQPNWSFNSLFRPATNKISQLPLLALCEGNPLVIPVDSPHKGPAIQMWGESTGDTSGFPSQRANNSDVRGIYWWYQWIPLTKGQQFRCEGNLLVIPVVSPHKGQVMQMWGESTGDTSGFPSQMASNAENVPMSSSHHDRT